MNDRTTQILAIIALVFVSGTVIGLQLELSKTRRALIEVHGETPMSATPIEWTDHSINPIRARFEGRDGHHCVKISPGCKHCYSSALQRRFGLPMFQEQRNEQVRPFLDATKLYEVLRRKKPTKYFWCDMTDIFGEWVPNEWIAACFGVMAATPQHTHQVLTKRPARAFEWFKWASELGEQPALECIRFASKATRWEISGVLPRAWPLSNVWLGASAEDQQRLDERVAVLSQCPAAVRFFSLEPLLGPIDMSDRHRRARLSDTCGAFGYMTELGPTGANHHPDRCVCQGAETTPHKHYAAPPHRCARCSNCDGYKAAVPRKLDWVIIGGESGPNARPCEVGWVRAIVRWCQSAGVPVFVKQLGARPAMQIDTELTVDMASVLKAAGEPLRDRKGGDPSEWPVDLRVREFPAVRS